MDTDGKTLTDISLGDDKKNSIIENNTETKIRNLQDIQEFANKIVSLKNSLLQGNICSMRQSVPDNNSCVINVNAINDSDGQNALKVPSAIVANTVVMPLCSDSLNDGPKIPNGDTLADNIKTKLHNVSEKSKLSKDCSKVDGETKNQIVEDKLTIIEGSEMVSSLDGDKCTFSKMSESCQKVLKDSDVNTTKDLTAGELTNTKKLDIKLETMINDSSSHSNAVKSCDSLQNTNRTDLNDKETSQTDNSISGEVLSMTEVQDVEIVVDDSACSTENDSTEDLNKIVKNVMLQTVEAVSSLKRTAETTSSSFYASTSSETNESCQNRTKEKERDGSVTKELTNLNLNNTGELDDKMEITIDDDHFSSNSIAEGHKSYQKNNRTGAEDNTERRKTDNLVVEKESFRTEDEIVVVDDGPSDTEIDVINVEGSNDLHYVGEKVQNESSPHENQRLINAESTEIGMENVEINCSQTIEVISDTEGSQVRNDLSYSVVEKKDAEKVDASRCEKDSDKTKEDNTLQILFAIQRGRRSSRTGSISAPSRYSPPPLGATPVKLKKRRVRNSDTFQITADVLLPFKLGWLREVVERATCSSPKNMLDVYYRSPDGTKLRSIPDVVNYLRFHPECALSDKNFTFAKTFIYREPFEVRRKAKARMAGSQINSPKILKQENNKSPKKENNRSQKSKSGKTPSQENKPEPISQTLSGEQDKPEVIICDDNEPPMKRLKANHHEDGSTTEETPILQMPNEDTDQRHVPSILKRLHGHPSKRRKKDTFVTRSQLAKAMGDFSVALNIYEKVHMKLAKPHNDYSRSLHKLDDASGKDVADSKTRKKQYNAKETNAVNKKEVTSWINENTKKTTIKSSAKDKVQKTNISSDEDLPGVDVNLCSNHCPGSIGEIPSLQCIVCLCLFHPKCMGLHRSSSNFICKRCEVIKSNREASEDKQDRHLKNVKTNTQALLDNSVQQNDSNSSDEDNATNVSVLTPEVVIQHDGSDQEELPMPTMLPYCFPNASTASTNTVSTSGQYSNTILNNKNNFIRPVPPLKPIPTLTPASQLSNQLLASKRIVASSTYFPPSVSESYNAYSRLVSTTTTNAGSKITSANTSCPPLIGIPSVGSSVRVISPQQLSNSVQPPPLIAPRPALIQSFNTGPPPLRFVASPNIPTNVGNSNRIALPNNSGSCLVLKATSNIFRPGTTTQLIGPFPSNSLPQIMLVNNKVVCVNPVANQLLPEQKGNSVLTNIVSVTQSLPTPTTKYNIIETRRVCGNAEQNNPYLAALLSSKETVSYTESINTVPGNVLSSNTTSPTVTVIDGKVSSGATPKLTAIIPPSFPVLRSSSMLQSKNTQVTTSVNYSLAAVSSVSGNRTLPESPYNSKASYARDSNLAKHIEETIKLCLSATKTTVLNDAAPPVLLNTNINKRLATSTTPAIKSPMTTARLLKGTESSLSLPKTVSLSDKQYASSEVYEKKVKLDVPLSSLGLESKQNGESYEDNSSTRAMQNTLSAKHVSHSGAFGLICDQPFRTTAFTPSFTSLLNTMSSCYNCLNNIFQYLTTMDLLRAKSVCKCWYKLASQQFLWRKVSLKNLVIVDWKKFAITLDLHGTTYLDMRGHGLLHSTWPCFVSVLSRLDKIRHVECGLIPAFVLYAMASKLVGLKSLSGECAMFSHWTTGKVGPCVINFNLLENFREMEKFQLRCQEGLMATVVGGLSPLSHLSKLRHLSLTTLENIDCEQFKFLKKLSNLETLEIGDCSSWTPEIYSYVGKMVKLQTLRLEKGGESDGLADALSNLKSLKELHLVIYKIPTLLEVVLKGLINLRLLSIWPDTTTNGSFQNYKALHAVKTLNHLQELHWVVLSDAFSSVDDEISPDEEGTWRNRLEDYKECQIDFSDPVSDTPLMSLAELKGVVKSLPLKDNSKFITIKELHDSLQEALPSTKIKILQVPLKQLRKYSAFR